MRLSVKVTTNARQEKIEKISENEFKAYLTCVPEKGKANKVLIKLFSKYFKTAKSNIKIVIGEKNRNKVLEIL